MNDSPWNGLVVVDKPSGLASNKALGRLKTLLGLGGRGGGKAGFLGTLDPLATGVLPVFLGKATKLIPLFEGLDKTYRVTIRLGQSTDTQDAEGRVTAERDIGHLTESAVHEVILAFQGELSQRVPSYSAVKIDGQPAYRLARAGQTVPERQRTVRVWDVEVESVSLPLATFRMTGSAGTYVRALARDIGESLQCGAHVTALRRLACGTLFTLENSYTLDGIEERFHRGDTGFISNPADYLPGYLPLTVDESTERTLKDGRTIPLINVTARPNPGAKVKAMRPCGTLIAIGEVVAHHHGEMGFQPAKVLV